MNIIYKQIKTIPEMIDVLHLRMNVFWKEQKTDPNIEFDKYDKNAYHFAAINKKTIVGVGRTRIINKKGKIERIAIDKKFRKKGIGFGITKFIIAFLRKKGVKNMYLHSQWSKKGFYKKIGFKQVGKTFYEAKIKHIKMVYQE